MDNVYDLATKVIEKAYKEAEAHETLEGHFSYSYYAGILQAHLKWMPDTKENIAYLLKLLRG